MIIIKRDFLKKSNQTLINKNTKLVALDIDGTICKDSIYNVDFNLFIDNNEFLNSISNLNLENNFKIILITNQSGIGRNFFSKEQFNLYIQKVLLYLEISYCIDIEFVYVCPHRPSGHCDCRKPSGNLLKSAIIDSGINFSKVVMFGDKKSDEIELRRATSNLGIFIYKNQYTILKNIIFKQ